MDLSDWTIRWNASLRVGIPQLDAEHQRFISLVNDLDGAIRGRHSKAKIERRLRFMFVETKIHFKQEEELLAERGYPEARRHAEQHAEITSQIVRILDESSRSKEDERWIESGVAIKKLLLDHLLKGDMKYRWFLSSSEKHSGA